MISKEAKDIYKLGLNETLETGFGISIMRVASGWIYDCWDLEKDNFKLGTFIPYSDFFYQDKELEKEMKVDNQQHLKL